MFLRKALHWIASKCPKRVISIDGDDYLHRYYVFGRFLGDLFDGKPILGWLPWTVYLHHFIRPDRDRELHNHPWDRSISIILSGGYGEQRLVGHTFDGKRTYGGTVEIDDYWPGAVNVINADDFHRVDDLHVGVETWTMFITGRKVQTWGFRLDDGSVMRWRDFESMRQRERAMQNQLRTMYLDLPTPGGVPSRASIVDMLATIVDSDPNGDPISYKLVKALELASDDTVPVVYVYGEIEKIINA